MKYTLSTSCCCLSRLRAPKRTQSLRGKHECVICFYLFQLSELEKARANHVAEMESLRCQFENALSTADQNHRATIDHFQERDQAWQTEKQVQSGGFPKTNPAILFHKKLLWVFH